MWCIPLLDDHLGAECHFCIALVSMMPRSANWPLLVHMEEFNDSLLSKTKTLIPVAAFITCAHVFLAKSVIKLCAAGS